MQPIKVDLHKQPLPHVLAIAIEEDGLAGGGLEDHHRDSLLGKLPVSVVVAAVGEHNRQAIGVLPGAHQVITGRLAR